MVSYKSMWKQLRAISLRENAMGVLDLMERIEKNHNISEDCSYTWGNYMIGHGCNLKKGHKLPHVCDCGNKSYGTIAEREKGHAL